MEQMSRGPRGERGYTVDPMEIEQVQIAKQMFGADRSEILIGSSEIPPNADWCKVYIYFKGASPRYYINGGDGNWAKFQSYMDPYEELQGSKADREKESDNF